jgi:hypothetical protein
VATASERLPQLHPGRHDRSLEIVLDALIASGQGDRTVVIFTSDHSEMAETHGLRQRTTWATTRTSISPSSSATPTCPELPCHRQSACVVDRP